MQTLRLPYRNHRINVPTSQIVRLEGSCNYTVIFLSNGKSVTVASTLSIYENKLPYPFVRIHKSTIINLDYANINYNGTSFILEDGTEIPVARRRKSLVKRILSEAKHV
jgi:two-component system LytT family response regulator